MAGTDRFEHREQTSPRWTLVRRCALALAVALAPAVACSLNPQPIPPGEQPDGGEFDADGGLSEAADASGVPTSAEAGAGTPPPSDGGHDAGDGGGGADAHDGGDAGDAGDADAG